MKNLKINTNGFSQEIVDSCIEQLKSWYKNTFDNIEEIIIEDEDTRKFYRNDTWLNMQNFCLENKQTHSLVMRSFRFGGEWVNQKLINTKDYTYAIVIKEERLDMSKLNALIYDDEENGATTIFPTAKEIELNKYSDLIDQN